MLQAITPGIGGISPMHDVFSIGVEMSRDFAGFAALVTYSWEKEAGTDALVTRVRVVDEGEGGKRYLIRRWVEPSTGQLVARSTAGSVTYTRWYDRVESAPGAPRLSTGPDGSPAGRQTNRRAAI